MDWVIVGSVFAGSLLCAILLSGIIIIWVYIDDRHTAAKKAAEDELKSQKAQSTQDVISERQLESLIVNNFEGLFPGCRIYGTDSAENGAKRLLGVRYRTEAGEIDVLCTDENDDFVVIELKRNRSPDTVVAQTDRYISWVEQHLAQPDQRVRGIIIARSHNPRTIYSIARRNDLELWTYDLKLSLTRGDRTELAASVVEP